MSTEFDKNFSDRCHDCTDHKNGIDIFMGFVEWPKNSWQKKDILEILGTKVVWFWHYTHKIDKDKKCPLK